MKSICLSFAAVALFVAAGCAGPAEETKTGTPATPAGSAAPATDLGSPAAPAGGEAGSTVKPGAPTAPPAGLFLVEVRYSAHPSPSP